MSLLVAKDRRSRRQVRSDARKRSAHRVEQLEDRLLLTAIAWNSPVDGDWNVAGNWLPAQVPGSGDDVTIDLAGFNPTITINDPRTVNSIVSRESLVVAAGGAFTVNAASQIDASTLTLNGNLTANGAVTITASGVLQWQAGTIFGNGLMNSGTITISAAVDVGIAGTLSNSGMINHTGTGNLIVDGTLTNSATGVYDFQSDADLFGAFCCNTLNNAGTIKKTGGMGVSTIGHPNPNTNNDDLTFNNAGGTLDAQSGTLQLFDTRGASTSGTFNAAAGAVLDLVPNSGGTFTGPYSGAGGGAVQLSGGVFNTTDPGVTFNFPAGLFQWTGGSIANTQLVRPFTNTGTITLTGADDKGISGSAFNNSGTIIHTGIGNLLINGTLNNSANAVYDFQSDADFFSVTCCSTLNNAGTIRKSAGLDVSRIGSPTPNPGGVSISFNNTSGTVDVQTGTIQLFDIRGASTGGTFNAATGAVLDLEPNSGGGFAGTYSGSGGGAVQLSGGVFNTTDPGVTFNFPAGLFQWTGGSIANTQLVRPFTNTGTITLAGANDKGISGSAFNNSGTIIHTGIGNLLINGTLNNSANAVYDFQSDADVFGSTCCSVFANTGTIRKSGGSDVSILGIPIPSSNVGLGLNNNGGTIESQTGRLNLNGGGLWQGGTLNASANSVLEISGNVLATGDFGGSGAGRVELSGVISSVDVGVAGAHATFNFPAGLLHLISGGFSSGGCGGFGGCATTPVNAGSLTIDGAADKGISGTGLINTGTIVHTGAGNLTLTGTLTNSATGTYDFQSDADLFSSHCCAVFANMGTIRKSGGSDVSILGVPIPNPNNVGLNLNNNGGTIEAISGRLNLSGGGLWQSGTLNAAASTAIEISGNLVATGDFGGSGTGRVDISGVISSVDVGVAGAHATFNFPDGLLHLISGGFSSGGCGSFGGCATTPVNAGSLTIDGPNGKGLGGTGLINEGTIINLGPGDFGTGGATFDNRVGAVYEHRGDSVFSGTDQFGNAGRFINAGTLQKTAGSGIVTLSAQIENAATGRIEVQSGRLRFSRGGNSTGGTFNMSAGAVLEFGGSNPFNMTGLYTGTGPGTIEFNSLLSGSDAANPARLNFPPGVFRMIGGQLLGAIVNEDTFDFAPATGLFTRATITNNGTFIHSGAGDFVLNANSRFINHGLYDLQTDADLVVPGDASGGSMFFINTGTFRKSGGLGTSSMRHDGTGKQFVFDNTGTLEVQSGTVEFLDSVTQFSASTLTAGTWIARPFTTIAAPSGGNLSTNKGHVTLDGPTATFSNINALSNNQGSFTLAGGRDFLTAGNLTNSGRLRVGPGSVLTVNGAFTESTANNLVGWWRGEGDATDSSGNNLNGTVQGTVPFEAGQFGQAFSFDGERDFVQIGNPAALRLSDFTISAWVKRDSTTAGGLIFGYGQSGYGLGLFSDGRLFLTQIGVSNVESGNLRITDTNFHHVAVTKSGGTVTFYVDGVAGIAAPYTPSFSFFTNAAIAARADTTEAAFVGRIDEVAVFNRPLAASELDTLRTGNNAIATGLMTPSIGIEIGGRPRSGKAGRIDVRGAATLAGGLEITRTAGYGPTANDVYQVMNYTSRSGNFADMDVDPFFTASVNATNVTLSVGPDAPTYDLSAAGITSLPAAAEPGQSVMITYQTQVASGIDLGGSWFDSIYLSRDTSLGPNDLVIGRVEHTTGVTANGSYSETLTAPLPAVIDGDYFVIVVIDSRGFVPDPNRANNELVSTGTIDVTVPVLPFDSMISSTIADGQDAYFRLDVPFGGDVLVTANFTAPQQAEFYLRFDDLPTRSVFDFSAPNLAELNRSILLTSPRPGPYYLLMHGREGAGAGTPFDLKSQQISFEVRSVTPGRGGNAGTATSELTGAGFSPDTTAVLRDNAGQTVATGVVRFVDSNRLFASFDLGGITPGRYDLVVARPGGEVVVDDGFEVVAGNPGRLETSIQMPARVRGGRIYDGFFEYTNAGDSDLVAPVITLNIADEDRLTLSPTANPTETSVAFLAISQGGPAGILPPGASGRVAFRFFNGGAGALVSSQIGEVTNSSAMDWDALKSDIRPDNPSSDWDAAFDSVFRSAGTTLGDYVRVLAAGATLHQLRVGRAIGDLDELHFFLIQEAQQTMRANLTGRVFRRDTAHPLGGVVVAATEQGTGNAFTAVSFADGLVRFQDLPPGVYDLSFQDVLDPAGLQPVTITAGQVVNNQVWVVADGGRVEGFARSDAGLPITDDVLGVVAVHEDGRTFVGRVETVGRYEILGLPAGTYRIEFSSPETQLVTASGINVLEDATTFAPDVVLGSVGTVTGIVRDATTSTPLSGVTVGTDGPTNARSIISGADGTFSLPGVAAGMQTLIANLAAYQLGMTSVDVMPYETTSGVIIELIQGASLEGVVTSNGQPVAAAAVDLLQMNQLVDTIFTDTAGMYRFVGLAGDDYTLEVMHREHAPNSSDFTLPAMQATTRDVELADASTVRGQATRASDGRSLPGLALAILDSTGAQTLLLTEPDGSFQASNLDPGNYTLMVADGSNRQSFTIVDANSDLTLNVTLDTGDLRGRVRAADGQPTEFRVAVFALRSGQVVAETLTAEDGSYAFPLLVAGIYDVLAQSPLDSFPLVSGAVVTVGGSTVLPDVMPGDANLVVTLQDAVAGGLVTADAVVVLSRQDVPEAVRSVFTAEVEPDGTVRFANLPAGQYKLEAIMADRAAPQVLINLSGNAVADIQLAASAALAGAITVPAGASAEELTISLFDPADATQLHQTVADAAGNYSIPALPPGTYNLIVADLRDNPAQRLASQSAAGVVFTAGNTTTQNFTLAAAMLSISGQILSADGSSPAGALVMAADADGHDVGVAVADVNGNFQLSGLPPGDYTLRATARGFVINNLPVTVAAGGPTTGVTMDAAWSASSLSLSSDLPAEGGLQFARSIVPQWVSGIIDGTRAWFRRVFGEPQDPSPNYGAAVIKPECEAARALQKRMLRMQMFKIDAFQAWHERWVGAVDILAADLFDFGRNLLSLAQTLLSGAFQAASAVKALDSARLEVAGEIAAGGAGQFISLTRELDQLNDLAANMRILLRGEKNAGLLGSLASSFRLTVSFDSFLKKIQDISSWDSVDDYYKLLDDANSFVDGVLSISSLAQFALDRLAGIEFPAVKKLLGPLGLITDILGTVTSGINGIRSLKNTIDDLKAKEDFYKETVRRRDALYEQTVQAIAACYEKCEDKPKPPKPPCRGANCPGGPSGGSSGVFSSDPNEKATTGVLNPSLASSAAFIDADTPIHYVVRFENLASATAPAQEVFVTDTLDANLDLNTLDLGDFGFGDLIVDVPAGMGFFQTRLDLISTFGFVVDFEASLDSTTRQLRFTFRSIDPETGDLVADPLAGFLPPEDSTGRGQGFVTFTMLPSAGLANGTSISNSASIVFDTNSPLVTNTVVNTIDTAAPSSTVSALPATTINRTISVNWSGNDGVGPSTGSGIAFFDVFVSDNGGPFMPFQTGTAAMTADFTGEFGHTYGFFSIATDGVGHSQPTPAGAQATTTLMDSGPLVTDARINADAARKAIANIVLTFDESLAPATASNPASFTLHTAGKDKRPGTADDGMLDVATAAYDDVLRTVTLTAQSRKPLKLNQLIRVTAKGTGGVTSLSGASLDGDANNAPGGDFVRSLGLGTKLSFPDPTGDVVALTLKKGGLIELSLPSTGDPTVRLTGTVAGTSTLTGTVKKPKAGSSDGRATIASITGSAGVNTTGLVRCSPAVTTNCLVIGSISAMVVDAILESGLHAMASPI